MVILDIAKYLYVWVNIPPIRPEPDSSQSRNGREFFISDTAITGRVHSKRTHDVINGI
jgi:hypothetical protein